jgi:hypothetical protein
VAKPKHGAVSFIIVIVVIYLLVRYWTNIAAAVAPTLAAAGVIPATTPAATTLPIINMASGAPGSPAFTSGFGGSDGGVLDPQNNNNGITLFSGPLGGTLGTDGSGYSIGRSGGLGGGAIEDGNSQGGGDDGPVPNGFGNCSTNPRDGKLLCI